ncbi:MAG: type II secretion system protein [Patescibacteria group bacterium]
MITNKKRGFTLIELLVVIAIIGILSSVVLASLNTARGKGSDAAIKSQLAGLRAQAEIVYDSNTPNSYAGLCANANILAGFNAAIAAAGPGVAGNVTLAQPGTATIGVCHLAANNFSWAINVPMKTSSANSWCVDSAGTSKQITAGYLAGNSTICP